MSGRDANDDDCAGTTDPSSLPRRSPAVKRTKKSTSANKAPARQNAPARTTADSKKLDAEATNPSARRRSPAVKHQRSDGASEKDGTQKAKDDTPPKAGTSSAPKDDALANKEPTPHSASAQSKSKKQEPTLLTDFLLGRPTPVRTRQKRSDTPPPMELKSSYLPKMQPPGRASDRVRKWQKASAAAVIDDPAGASEEPAEINDDDYNDDGNRGKGSRRSNPSVSSRRGVQARKHGPPIPANARGAPKKKVVNDSNWVKQSLKHQPRRPDLMLNKSVDPAKISNLPVPQDNAAKVLPKDLMDKRYTKQPLEKKIRAWAEQTAEQTPPTLPTKDDDISKSKKDSNANESRHSSQKAHAAGRVSKEGAENARPTPTPQKIPSTKESRHLPPKTPKPHAIEGFPKDFVDSSGLKQPLDQKIRAWAEQIAEEALSATDGKASAAPPRASRKTRSSSPKAHSKEELSKKDVVASPISRKSSHENRQHVPSKSHGAARRLPKDFVDKTSTKQPLESKVRAWAEQTAKQTAEEALPTKDEEASPRPRSPKPKKHSLENEPRRRRSSSKRTGDATSESQSVTLPDEISHATSAVLNPGKLRRKSTANVHATRSLPKDFIDKDKTKQPLERKTQDWAEQTAKQTAEHVQPAEVEDASPTPQKRSSHAIRSRHSSPEQAVRRNSVSKSRPFTSANDHTPEKPASKSVEGDIDRRAKLDSAKTNEPDLPKTHAKNRLSKDSIERKGAERPSERNAERATDKTLKHTLNEQPKPLLKGSNASDSRHSSPRQAVEHTRNEYAKPMMKGSGASDNWQSSTKQAVLGGDEGLRTQPQGAKPASRKAYNDEDDVDIKPKSKVGIKSSSSVEPLGDPEELRRRDEEEYARRQDMLANSTDATRACDVRTLAPSRKVQINQARQVKAKEIFDFDFQHSSGHRMACEVEIIVRDSPHGDGDVLICELDDGYNQWLLFSPIDIKQISARKGKSRKDIIVMVRGHHHGVEWREQFLLRAELAEIADEFVEMLGSVPMPSFITRYSSKSSASKRPKSPLLAEVRNDEHLYEPASDHQLVGSVGAKAELAVNHVSSGTRRGYNADPAPSPPHSKNTDASGEIDIGEETKLNPGKKEAWGIDSAPRIPPTKKPLQKDSSSIPRPQVTRESPPLSSPRRNTVDTAVSGPLPTAGVEDPVLNPSPQNLPNDQDGVPPPPAHRHRAKSLGSSVPTGNASNDGTKNKLISSPLKHEYQPSHASATSSASYASESYDFETESDISSDNGGPKPEANMQSPEMNPGLFAPVVQQPRPSSYRLSFSAHISSWSEKSGRWETLTPEACSIVVKPGSIEALDMDACQSSPDCSQTLPRPDQQPLIALALTPVVMIRQSNGLDIEIHSPPLETSLLKCSHIVRFRMRSDYDCRGLYAAAHRARKDNEEYNGMQRELTVKDHGKQPALSIDDSKARHSWFGRKRDYRVSARTSSTADSDESAFSFGSAFMALKRLSNGGGSNGNRPSFDTDGTPNSTNSRDSSSASSAYYPPLSNASTGTMNNSLFDANNLTIRLYRAENSKEWREIGLCRLTIAAAPQGMQPTSSLNTGIPKRVTLTECPSEQKPAKLISKRLSLGHREEKPQAVYFDGILGARCFSRVQRVGIVMNVWEDMIGPKGEVGMPSAFGGVSGRQRKWMFHCSNSLQARWIFALLGAGV